MKKPIIISISLIILILFLIASIYLINKESLDKKEYYVLKVIDGDTFTLNNGESVRLLCINTPEKNEKVSPGAVARPEKCKTETQCQRQEISGNKSRIASCRARSIRQLERSASCA